MTVAYDFTLDDITAFNVYHQGHSKTGRRAFFVAWLIPAFLLLLICIGIWSLAVRGRGRPVETFVALLPLFASVPLFLAVYPLAYRRRIRRFAKRMISEGANRALFTRHEVTITPESVSESTEFGQTVRLWRGIEKVATTPDYIFIYVNTVGAILVPRRAFTNAAQFDEFAALAREYHEEAVEGRN